MEEVPEIPGYRIERTLGEGGMAKVYFGVQEKLKRKVAIKVLEPLLLKDKDFARRFLKEAETAANLIHPHIVTIYDVGKVGQHYYMVMEYLDGTLKDMINESSRNKRGLWQGDFAASLDIIKKVGGALEYAHKRGFIHRDIKPDNIMFRHDGTPVLVDFGIAKALDATTQLTRTGMSVGTPHYMSPEQIRGQDIDGRADLYSLGVVFYEMLMGEVPYRASDYIAVAVKHLNEPIPRLPSPLSQYQPLIDKMMAKDRANRVQSAGKLIPVIEDFQTKMRGKKEAAVKERPKRKDRDAEAVVTIPTLKKTEGTGVSRMARILGVAAFVLAVVVVFWVIQFTSGGSSKEEKQTEPPVEERLSKVQDGKPEPTEIKNRKPDPGESITSGQKTALTAAEQKAYDGYVETARKQSGKGDYRGALDNIEKAERIQKSDELELLEGEVLKKEAEAKTQKRDEQVGKTPVKPPPKKKVGPPVTRHTPDIRTINLINLPRELSTGYHKKMERIVIPDLPSGVKVMGPVSFNFSIDEKGNLGLKRFSHPRLKVVPKLNRQRVLKMILDKVNDITLAAPRDEQGQPVKVENWRLLYRVGTFAGKIILNRRSI